MTRIEKTIQNLRNAGLDQETIAKVLATISPIQKKIDASERGEAVIFENLTIGSEFNRQSVYSAEFRNCIFTEDIIGAGFYGCDFSNCNFSNIFLSSCSFNKSRLNNCNFSKSHLIDCEIGQLK
tara:strand:+ start:2670 stop:3041 length:372 start_codon:yes stop_codon:yes gene_type:complete